MPTQALDTIGIDAEVKGEGQGGQPNNQSMLEFQQNIYWLVLRMSKWSKDGHFPSTSVEQMGIMARGVQLLPVYLGLPDGGKTTSWDASQATLVFRS